ncbi:hypothetical protein MMC10_007417 [Thelotrema lepadinum]|nr:hypothetical protein [Thelotrema lepadinum]
MPQHLQTTSPSPTTISYTVSSSPPLTSLPSKLLFALSTSIRLSLLSWSLWTLYLSSTCLLLPTWKPPSTCFPPSPIPTGWAFFTLEIPLTNTLLHLLGWNPPSSSSSSSSSSARATLLSALLPPSLALATLFFSLKRPHKTESLLVLHTLGIQTSSSSKFFGFGPQTRFVPTSEIQDVFIHEGFTRSVGLGREVRYYLGVVMKEGGEGVWVVFPVS